MFSGERGGKRDLVAVFLAGLPQRAPIARGCGHLHQRREHPGGLEEARAAIVARPVERGMEGFGGAGEPPEEEDEDVAGERSRLLHLRQHRGLAEEGDRRLDVDPELGAVEKPRGLTDVLERGLARVDRLLRQAAGVRGKLPGAAERDVFGADPRNPQH